MTDAQNTDPKTRKQVADHLYPDRGPVEASSRCDANTKFGAVDLCTEMIRHLRLAPGQSVIDVGCGTGQHLARFAETVGPSGSARGFDFSAKAVEKARTLGVQADTADGAKLPVEAESFDALGSSFAIYYLPDARTTLTEWHRVLRPGGRIAISGPATDTNAELYQHHLEITGGGPADTDLMALGYVAALPPLMREIGFDEVAVETFTNPIAFPTADAFLDYWANTSLFARTVSDTERDAVLARGRERLAGKSGPFVVTKRVEIATGVRR